MSQPANVPLNIGLVNAMQRLGIVGGVIPGLAGQLVPVLVVGDISQSLSSEVVEARASGSGQISAGGAFPGAPWIQLHALSPGGVVIEECLVARRDALAGDVVQVVFATVGAQVIDLPSVDEESEKADVGGVATTSTLRRGLVETSPLTLAGLEFFRIGCDRETIVSSKFYMGSLQSRVWVGPSEFFTLFLADLSALFVYITWRELGDPQGGN